MQVLFLAGTSDFQSDERPLLNDSNFVGGKKIIRNYKFRINTCMPTSIQLTCQICNVSFQRSSNDLASAKLKNTKHVYCSKQCKNISERTQIDIICKHCNNHFQKRPSQIARTRNSFCSKSCAATYNNTHKTYGTRRSKLEVFLESQIRATYPDLKLLCNDKTAINSELDFYFPDLQLAIELNGILHFEPIYGNGKLDQIQSNDNKKSFLCSQNQINLAVIDTSMHKHCNQAVKEKFWNIVAFLIQTNLAEGVEFESTCPFRVP